ncbi:hypothetical protein LG202_10670 [Methylobacillus methanolivorans]
MIAIEMPQIRYVMGSEAKRYSTWADVGYGSHYKSGKFQYKHAPAVALIAAAGTVKAGIAAGGLLGGIMITGGIASALGTITGNKTLSTIGTVSSLASVGATAFMDQAKNFVNPLTNFGDSMMGSALGNMKDGIGKFFGDLTNNSNQTASSVGVQTGDMLTKAAAEAMPDTTQKGLINSLVESGSKGGIKLGADVFGKSVSTNPGLLNSILDSKDMLNLGVGLSNGYYEGQKMEQNQPLVDAQTGAYNANANKTNYEVQQQQQRTANLQAQPEIGLMVNPNANVFSGKTQPQGKMLVNFNGTSMFITPEEAQALNTQINQSGLLYS